jgi:aldose 1-epimerase
MSIEKTAWGTTPDGSEALLYTLTNANGMVAKISDYGGIVTSLMVPGRDGKMADVVLGYDTLDEYVNDSPYFGCITGRYANRIRNGKFTLEGVEYSLAVNNGPSALHGGLKGFDKVVWDSQPAENAGGPSLRLMYISPDGEEGYPGTLTCGVTYTLGNDNALKIEYDAVTDRTTVLNLTNHSYFNLAGHDSGDVFDHEMMINADYFTPLDETQIPTGEIASVAGGPMDFTKPMTIGSCFDLVEGGYDHNYILKSSDGTLALAARVRDNASGRVMEAFTTEPAMQFYAGNYLDTSLKGKGAVYDKQHGFCLEMQHYPDSPNKPDFPTTVLHPGERYTQTTIYKFSAK